MSSVTTVKTKTSSSLVFVPRPVRLARDSKNLPKKNPKPTVVAASSSPSFSPFTGPAIPATEFRRFSKLPPEIQWMIWWQHAENMRATQGPLHPLRFRVTKATGHIRRADTKKKERRPVAKLLPLPEVAGLTRIQRELVSINADTRFEFTKKFYPDRLQLLGGGFLPFNAEETIIYLDNQDRRPLGLMCSQMKHPQQPRFMDVVKHLGIDSVPINRNDWGPLHNGYSEFGFAPEFLLAFEKLESVSAIAFDTLRENAHNDRQHLLAFQGFHKLEGLSGPYGHGKERIANKQTCPQQARWVGDGVLHAIRNGRDRVRTNRRPNNTITKEQKDKLAKIKFRRLAVIEDYKRVNLAECTLADLREAYKAKSG